MKDVKDVPAAIQKWEGKLRVVQREFGEKLSDHMRIAILTSIVLLLYKIIVTRTSRRRLYYWT